MPTKCKRRFRPPTEGEKQRVWISNLGDIVLREMASQPTNTEVREMCLLTQKFREGGRDAHQVY